MQRYGVRTVIIIGSVKRRCNETLRRPSQRLLPLSSRSMNSTATFATEASPSSNKKNTIPTRHSIKGPPRICKDPVELKELTQQVLETPVGSLYCQDRNNRTASPFSKAQDRDDAYAVAQESSQLLEYLLRGYNHQIPGSLYAARGGAKDHLSVEDASATLLTMMNLLERFEEEGQTYLTLRHEDYTFRSGTTLSSTVSSLSAFDNSHDDNDETSSSSSSSSEDDNDLSIKDFEDDDDEEIEIGSSSFGVLQDKLSTLVQHKHERGLEELVTAGKPSSLSHLKPHLSDFSLPGVTTVMYDSLLDAMACATELLLHDGNKPDSNSVLSLLDPSDFYHITQDALTAHELNNQRSNGSEFFPYTIPTMVTYNASLRGIGNLCLAGSADVDPNSKQQLVDQGLAYGFGIYNHLTHNDHTLPKRNAATMIHLLTVIRACLPPSRTRGNMSVTLWYQASREGLVTPELVAAIREVHAEPNGPEFEVFLDALEKCQSSPASSDEASEKVVIMPQRFARFAKKYQHSKNY
jgi:hypothetical protein